MDEEAKKKHSALKSLIEYMGFGKTADDIKAAPKKIDVMDLGEDKVTRDGKPCPNCGK